MGLAFPQDSFQILVKTNNGIERQNKSFKYEYLKKKRKKTIRFLKSFKVSSVDHWLYLTKQAEPSRCIYLTTDSL